MPKRVILGRVQRHILTRLAEGWQLVGNYLVDRKSAGPRPTREWVSAAAIKSLANRGIIKQVKHPFALSYELSDAGRAGRLADDSDDSDE